MRVAEGAIKAATLELARSGLYVEPTCAQAAAAYHELLASGAIQPAEVAVVLLTGTGLGSVSEVSRKRLGDGGRAHRDGRQGDAARGRDPRGRAVRRPGHRRRQTIARGERHRADARPWALYLYPSAVVPLEKGSRLLIVVRRAQVLDQLRHLLINRASSGVRGVVGHRACGQRGRRAWAER